jgi:hypothetical protein
MATIMSEKYKEALLDGLTKKMNEKNPFINEDGKTYVRYDMITITNLGLGDLTMKFYWRGDYIFSKNIEGLMSSDIDINIGSIEGRVEISFSSY